MVRVDEEAGREVFGLGRFLRIHASPFSSREQPIVEINKGPAFLLASGEDTEAGTWMGHTAQLNSC
jgi:hypothetical protein